MRAHALIDVNSPVEAGMIEGFGGYSVLLPPLGPATSAVPGHCPPPRLPLRDPVIESTQRGVYFGPTSERSRWREGKRAEIDR